MKKAYIKRIVGFFVFAGIVGITMATLMSNKEIADEKIYEYDKSKPIHVVTKQVQLTPIQREQQYSGTFQPNKEVKISAETQGKITNVFVDHGDVVKEGQPLLKLDQSLLKLQLGAVKTKIGGLEKDIARYKKLVESNAIQGVKLEKALLGLDAAQIERATVQEQLNKAIIRAPFDGIITAKLTEKGAFAAPGIPLFQLTDIATLKFTILVTEYEVNKFQRNDTIQLTVDALPNDTFHGVVTMVGSKANKSMNFPVEISTRNKSMQVKAGMFGHATTDVSEKTDQGILIPLAAIIGESDAPKVYIIEEGKAKFRDIVIGGTIENKAIVKKGLKTDDVIVVEGITNLFEGANVITK